MESLFSQPRRGHLVLRLITSSQDEDMSLGLEVGGSRRIRVSGSLFGLGGGGEQSI